MKVGDLVKAKHNKSMLGIITKISRSHYGFKEVIEFTVLWNSGVTDILYRPYLEAVNKKLKKA